MARDAAALSLLADLAGPLGIGPARLPELARDVAALAAAQGVAWPPAPGDGSECCRRLVHDAVFGSVRWREEVGYVHPMDQLR